MTYKQQIIELRSQGKTYSEIKSTLGCSKSTISFHLSDDQKMKNRIRNKIRRIKHPFIYKVGNFLNRNISTRSRKSNILRKRLAISMKIRRFSRNRKTGKYTMSSFTYEDVISKFSEKPVCYLTGEQIDIGYPRSYHFDHKVPVSKGGTNTIDNLGICTADANNAKHDKTQDEFIELCKRVLIHHGYSLTKS